MLGQGEQFAIFIFWLSLKEKLLYAHTETTGTLKGEISTEVMYFSGNNNTNFKKVQILSIYTIWDRLSLKTITRYCPFNSTPCRGLHKVVMRKFAKMLPHFAKSWEGVHIVQGQFVQRLQHERTFNIANKKYKAWWYFLAVNEAFFRLVASSKTCTCKRSLYN